MLRAILGFSLLVGCSQGPVPRRSSPPSPPPTDTRAEAAPALPDRPITDTCATDEDCAVGQYPEIGTGCCAYRCGYDVVTASRAAARKRDYEARCAQARCQPHDCPAFQTPYPVCRESRCVDQGHPGVSMPSESR